MLRSKTREDELSILVNNEQPDVVIISEAELGLNDTVVISGYTPFFATPAPSGKHRLFALVKTTLKSNTVILASSHTDIWLRLNLPSPLIIVGMYRQWSDTERLDLSAFHSRCASLLDGTRTIVTGDLNLDFKRKSDPSYTRHSMASEHFSTMEALGLRYMGPYTPTFRSHGSYKSADGRYCPRTSIIDHVYALNNCRVEVSALLHGVTDHLPVKTTVFECATGTPGRKWIFRRPLAKLTSVSLCSALEHAFSETDIDIYNCDDVNLVHDTIISTIHTALDRVAPRRLVPADRPDRPSLFLSPDTLEAMKLRDAAAIGHSNNYRALRNKACRLVRRDRMKSSLKLIDQACNNPKKIWSLAKSFMGAEDTHANLPSSLVLENGSESSDPTKLAESLNVFFIEKISKIREDIAAQPPSDCHVDSQNALHSTKEKFTFRYPSAGKIEAIIASLKNTGAVGYDEVPVSILKKGAPVLSGPIAHLVRLSLGSATVPSGFKTSIVSPIYKGKGKSTTSLSSFRPISILTAMSKVLERCVFETLANFLETRLPDGQYGFRQKRSTTMAIADAHGKWSSARASGKVLGIMGFDLASAFDTLDEDIVCSKLDDLGICGLANRWFKDYLKNRIQCVSVGPARSSFMPLKYGVPQGSILGPVLFLAMVADMPRKTRLLDNPCRGYVAYADDLCVWSAGDSAEAVRKDLTVIAANVLSYTTKNYMSLSAGKTQMLWSGLSRGCEEPNVRVGGTLVKPTSIIELLGVKFDRNLSPAPYMASQISASMPILATVRRLYRYLPPTHLAMVAAALLVGKLAYAAPAVITPRLTAEDPTVTNNKKLQICINDAARITMGLSLAHKVSTECVLAKTGLPSLNRLVVKCIAIECWKAINLCTPLGSLITSGQKSSRSTRLACSNKLTPPFKFYKDSMAWHAVRIWNLYEDLRNAPTLGCAKSVATRIAASCPI